MPEPVTEPPPEAPSPEQIERLFDYGSGPSESSRPSLGLREASKACAVSFSKIKRMHYTTKPSAFPNAWRTDTADGPGTGEWRIPITDLILAGLQPNAPAPGPDQGRERPSDPAPEPPAIQSSREAELIAERDRWRAEAEKWEAVAIERDRWRIEAERWQTTTERAFGVWERMLPAGPLPTAVVMGQASTTAPAPALPAADDHPSDTARIPRRRWLRR